MGIMEAVKRPVRRGLFRAFNIGQIHVIGCSRSGTTMMHAAMTAFENVIINPEESSAEHPVLSHRLQVVREFAERGVPRGERKWFITKRGYTWFEPSEIERLYVRATGGGAGIILMVRDPRDVLLSKHPQFERERFSDVPFWIKEARAGEALRERLEARGRFLVVRYEDVVTQPREVEAALTRTFGLKLRTGAQIDRVRDSLESSGAAIKPVMAKAMHGVRNADASSIGKWRSAPANPETELLANPEAAPLFREFASRYGYA